MNLKSSQLIERISKMTDRPTSLSGYLLIDDDNHETLTLYPQLDPRRYYIFDRNCVLDVIPTENNEHGYVTLLVDPNCQVECVDRTTFRSCDLARKQSNTYCDCENPGEPGLDFLAQINYPSYIRVARLLKFLGMADVDCEKMGTKDSVSKPCCRAWKDLVLALDTDQVRAKVQRVAAVCHGEA